MAQVARLPVEGTPNPRRRLEIDIEGQTYLRLPIRTPVVTETDDIVDVIAHYAGAEVRPGDVVFVSEKVVAITQGRAIPVEEIRVSLLARLLWPRVAKVKYGIGLRSPYSMQCARLRVPCDISVTPRKLSAETLTSDLRRRACLGRS